MNENNFIEVDGIRFETLVLKGVLTVLKKDLIDKLSDKGVKKSKYPSINS